MDVVTHKQPIRSLYCAVCGARTRGRQWHNRDTGYGLCLDSFLWLINGRMSAEEIQDLYGIRGVHFDVWEPK